VVVKIAFLQSFENQDDSIHQSSNPPKSGYNIPTMKKLMHLSAWRMFAILYGWILLVALAGELYFQWLVYQGNDPLSHMIRMMTFQTVAWPLLFFGFISRALFMFFWYRSAARLTGVFAEIRRFSGLWLGVALWSCMLFALVFIFRIDKRFTIAPLPGISFLHLSMGFTVLGVLLRIPISWRLALAMERSENGKPLPRWAAFLFFQIPFIGVWFLQRRFNQMLAAV